MVRMAIVCCWSRLAVGPVAWREIVRADTHLVNVKRPRGLSNESHQAPSRKIAGNLADGGVYTKATNNRTRLTNPIGRKELARVFGPVRPSSLLAVRHDQERHESSAPSAADRALSYVFVPLGSIR